MTHVWGQSFKFSKKAIASNLTRKIYKTKSKKLLTTEYILIPSYIAFPLELKFAIDHF